MIKIEKNIIEEQKRELNQNVENNINNQELEKKQNQFLQTTLGNLNMYGNILAGVLFTGVGNYSLHVENVSGQVQYLSPDNIVTTSSGINSASCVLYGICTVR